MDRTERFYKIDQLLNEKIVVSIEIFLDDLGVSLATFKRDLEYMRERLHAPILWDRDAGGYRYTQPDPLAPTFALPGGGRHARSGNESPPLQQSGPGFPVVH